MTERAPGLPGTVLIANRGEIAVRIARTCRAMGIGTVAVFSDADARALHVEACDEAVRIGGASPAASYLDAARLVEAALRTGADAIHPGYGFLAEAPAFARAVLDAGLVWVGPPPEVIAAMGDKLEAKRRMAEAGVPLVPGLDLSAEQDPAAIDPDEVRQAVGFPVMVKAAGGGGGKGMRVVLAPEDLRGAIAAARREAGGAFGDDRVFLERYVAHPRHLEVQVIGDAHGTLLHLFERECSVQRRHQKVVEETPSPGIDARVREALCAAAVDAARAIGYRNAGTVEFVADEAVLARLRAGEDVDARAAFAFLEVNTRLQVEHPVTEEVVRVRDPATGATQPVDLVRLQLLVAAGEPLPFGQEDLVRSGHAIEVRLYAEDPTAGYLPATGTLHALVPAGLPGVRWDSGVRSGDEITPHYDPMLAKVIAWAPARSEAAAVLARELDRTQLVGATTNRDLLVGVLRDPAFLAGATTTGFLEERFPGGRGADDAPDAGTVRTALIAATVADAVSSRAGAAVLATLRAGFTNAATFEPWRVCECAGAAWSVRYRVERSGVWRVRVSPGDAPEDGGPHPDASTHEVRVHGAGDGSLDVEVDGHRQAVRLVRSGDEVHVVTAAGRVVVQDRPRFPVRRPADVAGATLAPMPGSVVAVRVSAGDAVARGQVLVALEAMKMEHQVTAPVDGTVAEVRVAAGDQVDADEVLVVVEPAGAGD